MGAEGGVLVQAIVGDRVLERRYADATLLADAVAARVAEQLRDALAARGEASLVVPGGRTPVPVFDRLCTVNLDWSHVSLLLSDERWVPATHEDSNEGLVRARLLREQAAAGRLVSLYRPTDSPGAALDAMEKELAAVPRPFDAVLLGMGEDGHFASLFPGDAALRVGLVESGVHDCVAIDEPHNGHQRLSLALSCLLQARVIVLMFLGVAKREVYEAALRDAEARRYPVAALLRQRRAPVEVHWAP